MLKEEYTRDQGKWNIVHPYKHSEMKDEAGEDDDDEKTRQDKMIIRMNSLEYFV